jgi:hypothetical protein
MQRLIWNIAPHQAVAQLIRAALAGIRGAIASPTGALIIRSPSC